MKARWKLVSEEVCDFSQLLTTSVINKNQPYVTIGHAGWGASDPIAYMPLPKNILEDPSAWQSEYREDEFPNRNISCLVQLQGTQSNNEGKLKIVDSYYLFKERKFLRIPDGWEVIGWTEHPKPYKGGSNGSLL